MTAAPPTEPIGICCASASATPRARCRAARRRRLAGHRHQPQSAGARLPALRPRSSAARRQPLPASPISSSRSRRMMPATRCSTATATTSPRSPASPGSAISRPPASMATAPAAGSTSARNCARAARAAGAGSPPKRAGSICGAERGVPVHIFRLAGIYGPGRSAVRRRCAPAPQSGSTSRARSSRASMSRIWRACCSPRSQGRAPARSTMCATTSRPRPPRSSPMPPACWGCRRRRWCRSRQPGCRRWRRASTTTTSASRTR